MNECTKVFYSIRETAKITGLSEHYIRQQKKAGKVPGVMCGNKFMVNVPALLQVLEGGV